MAAEDCGLCDIPSFELADRVIGGNEQALAVYVGSAGLSGECLIVPRRHEISPCGLTDDEVLALHSLKTKLYQGMSEEWHGIDVDEQYRLGPDMFGRPRTGEHFSIRMIPSIMNSARYESARRPIFDLTRPAERGLEVVKWLREFA